MMSPVLSFNWVIAVMDALSVLLSPRGSMLNMNVCGMLQSVSGAYFGQISSGAPSPPHMGFTMRLGRGLPLFSWGVFLGGVSLSFVGKVEAMSRTLDSF